MNVILNSKIFYRRFRSFIGKGWIKKQNVIVFPDQVEEGETPIFIIGTHRSGTSLVRRILDSHSRIACPPESFFLAHYFEMISDDLSSTGFDNLCHEGESVRAILARHAAYFHNSYKASKGKSRWADKTPQYVDYLPQIETLFGMNIAFVNVIRNPLDVAYSIWSRKWQLGQSTGDYLRDVCNYVRDSGQKQLDYFNDTALPVTRIRYEELISDPERVLRRVFVDIGEPWEPDILQFHKFPHDFGTEDPIVGGTRGIEPSLDNWKAWDRETLETIYEILSPLMRDLKYDTRFIEKAIGKDEN